MFPVLQKFLFCLWRYFTDRI